MRQKDRLQLQKLNHPQKGSSIKVEPIRDLTAIAAIKDLLKDDPRNLCLFVLGINTAYRASELLSIKVWQVRDIQVGDTLEIKQKKNGKYRRASLNKVVVQSTHNWLKYHPNPEPEAPLFLSKKRPSALTVSALTHMVKDWCAKVGLAGNYGSHTLRKTWGYQHRVLKDTPIPLLMQAYGHASQQQTLAYLGIQDTEIENVYMGLVL